MCAAESLRIYYEVHNGVYYLCELGVIQEFSSLESLTDYVSPEAELIQVTEDNYQSLYDAGVFF